MNSELEQNLIYSGKYIYNVTNITLYIFLNEKLIYVSKKPTQTAEKILFNRYPEISGIERNTKYQILKNEYREAFYIVSFKEEKALIIIGPFLNEQINEGMITNMVRKGIVSFHKKTEIKNYYKTLQVLDEDRIFYIRKLIENVFDNMKLNHPIKENSISPFDIKKDEYLNNIKQNRKNAFLHSTYANEQKVSETIRNGDTEKAKSLLKQINLTPHAKLALDDIRSYKNSMICSCTFMTRAAISGGVNPDEAFTLSDTFINRIENLQNIKELENFESIMVEGFTEMVNNVKTNKYSKSILNAMNYIDNHLCENIKIKDIASSSYLNPSYLSNLFHKETNMTISDWILNKRIKEAAFSVANSNEDFADIAFFYHFCSQSYFVKCFKKVIGMTPKEYRNNKNKDAI